MITLDTDVKYTGDCRKCGCTGDVVRYSTNWQIVLSVIEKDCITELLCVTLNAFL